MRVEELENRINQLPSTVICPGHGVKVMVAKTSVLELVRQLEEPKKVVVPKFVAEWIEKYKIYDATLLNVYKVLGAKKDAVSIWVNDNIDTFARAWLDGYTIEREKLYTVEIPNPNDSNWNYTVIRKGDSGVYITKADSHYWYNNTSYHLTEAEIRKDFEWAWQFAKEVE